MKRSQAVRAASITVLAVCAAAVHWPAPRVDVRPAFERPAVTPTETVPPLMRPERPPHPRSIYTPHGSHR